MIQYSFSISNPQNFQKIVTLIESNYSVLMHTSIPLPTSLTNIQGSLGLSSSPSGSILYITFFDSPSEYSLSDTSKTVIYQSKPMSKIPSESEIKTLISGLI